ncbi:hypothetical protein FGL97_01665 [Pseudomonas putida]|nr:hypothetical protein [Pseudomonas putida]NVN66950.1 hypothetical protein [Pseudomonas putida]
MFWWPFLIVGAGLQTQGLRDIILWYSKILARGLGRPAITPPCQKHQGPCRSGFTRECVGGVCIAFAGEPAPTGPR